MCGHYIDPHTHQDCTEDQTSHWNLQINHIVDAYLDYHAWDFSNGLPNPKDFPSIPPSDIDPMDCTLLNDIELIVYIITLFQSIISFFHRAEPLLSHSPMKHSYIMAILDVLQCTQPLQSHFVLWLPSSNLIEPILISVFRCSIEHFVSFIMQVWDDTFSNCCWYLIDRFYIGPTSIHNSLPPTIFIWKFSIRWTSTSRWCSNTTLLIGMY